MKKKLFLILIPLILLCLILFLPIPTGVMNDGGSREFTALTYKIVRWNRLISSEDTVETYAAWRFYPVPLNFADIDELWNREVANNPDLSSSSVPGKCFYATVSEVRDNSLLVDGLDTNELNYRYEFSLSIDDGTDLVRDGVEISLSDFRTGDTVFVEYTGAIQEVYPARITRVTRISLVTPEPEDGDVSYQAEYVRVDGSGASASVLLPFSENGQDASPDGWNRLPLIAIETKEELHQFISELKQTDAYKDGGLWNDTALFHDFPNTYDETFFIDNTLLLVYIAEGSSSNTHKIHSCSVDDGVCTVVVEPIVPEAGDCAMAGWIIALSVGKEAVKNVAFDAYRLRK